MYTHSNPIPQRSHKKSTTGCSTCKARKVKCDEKRPVCGRCSIHFANITSCDYTIAPSKRSIKKRFTSVAEETQPKKKVVIGVSQETPNLNGAGKLTLHSNRKPDLTNVGACRCPCHLPDFTDMLLDSVFGMCRICGNLPSLGHPTEECNPVVSPFVLMREKIDPFQVLPVSSSPIVLKLIHHWINTLSDYPTKINSQYCTNPTWLSVAISNSALFQVTLYVSSLHMDGLLGSKQSRQSLFYKYETIRVLNKVLKDPIKAASDETICAVLLLGNVLTQLGEPDEVTAHLSGVQALVNLRGGISNVNIEGCFLHMTCTTNHLSALLSESPLETCAVPYTPPRGYSSPSLSACSTSVSSGSSSADILRSSPLLKPFALSSGYDYYLVRLLHDMGYLYDVLDSFTTRLVPQLRKPFEELCEKIIGSGDWQYDSGIYGDPERV